MDVYYPHHTYNLKDSVSSLKQWPPENNGGVWPEDMTSFGHLTRHALVMGSTWGMLIPITILMASLRHKKVGWWFHLHRALAALSLVLVLIGVALGRRLRITHPPVTFAGKCHKVMGYTAASFICLQALSALLWRPLGKHSFRPTWNVLHQTWGQSTMAVGCVAVCLGIWVAGVGWPYYILFALPVGGILRLASLQKPCQASSKSELSVKDALRKATSNGHVDQAISGQATNSRIGESGRGTWTDSAGGLIPWLIRVQSSRKQA